MGDDGQGQPSWAYFVYREHYVEVSATSQDVKWQLTRREHFKMSVTA